MVKQQKAEASFDKEYLLKCLNGIYEEAYNANCSFLILNQILDYHKDGYKSLDCSPAFYSVVCASLVKSSIMDLMRIYDKNSVSIGLTKIIVECNRWKSEISSLYEDKDEIRPLSITLSSDEMQECLKDEKLKRKIEEEKRFHDTLNLPYDNHMEVEFTVEEFFGFCSVRRKKLKTVIDNLYTQRSKIYAHNDTNLLFDNKSILDDNKITYKNIKTLIDFALKFCIKTIYILSGEQKVCQPGNIDDVSNTWMLVKDGREAMLKRDKALLEALEKYGQSKK